MCKFNIVNDWKCEKPKDQAFHTKEGGKGLRFHWNCAWYHLCTVCMASILPSRSHGRYNPLLQCKGHIFPSSVERCSAEQRKYLGKRRSGSSLKGSFNRQRTTAGCYSTKPFLVKVQPLLRSEQCATWTEWRSRHVRSWVLRQGAVANEAPSQASARTHRDKNDSTWQLRVTYVANATSSEGARQAQGELLITTPLLLCPNYLWIHQRALWCYLRAGCFLA